METKKITHPHDKFFKAVFSRKKEAQDLLRAHLSTEILAKIDLDAIEATSASFVKPDLQDRYSDLVLKTNINGKSGYLYTIVEHQSTPDKSIFFRLVEYNNLLMQEHLKEGSKKVPSILNVVLYAGIKRYNVPTDFIAIAQDPTTFAFPLQYHLVNLIDMSDEKLLTSGAASFATLVLKHSVRRQFCKWVQEHLLLFRELILSCSYDTEVLYYLLELEKEKAQEIPQKLIKFVPELKQEIMTAGQRLRQEGRQMGRNEAFDMLIERGIVTPDQIKDLK